jgi:hypothetical protein
VGHEVVGSYGHFLAEQNLTELTKIKIDGFGTPKKNHIGIYLPQMN